MLLAFKETKSLSKKLKSLRRFYVDFRENVWCQPGESKHGGMFDVADLCRFVSTNSIPIGVNWSVPVKSVKKSESRRWEDRN